MLETRNLCKIYKPKKGVPVKALDNISLKFPEKGMIFLLGKSGSGKSTLLNLLGGLDKYDGGEIIIKGVSSKDFKQQYFDSYRNTYVGFIFQEYNILEEFSVGANIALAIELQGRKATDEEINNILKEVDLEGYGSRKPNELSGGQKQRVAIARALIKNPEIIMADEPTGALDSNTGKQVFDTLKKLSRDKLVIIVSHDRDFSEQYADRIIELSDGHVISDVELAGSDTVKPEDNSPEGLDFNGNIVSISSGYHLTEEDRVAINDYIDKLQSGSVSLTVKGKKTSNKTFVDTNQDKIKTQDGSSFKLIKSRLPLKNAFKIGASGLKYKKVKLVFTIILSCVAFGLFGLSDTFGSYNHVKTCARSIVDSEINYASLVKTIKHGTGLNEWWSDWDTTITKEELKEIIDNTGIEFTGVCQPLDMDLYFMGNFNTEAKFSESDMNIYAERFTGFSEINADKLEAMGYEILAGKIPDGSKNEIAISEYVYETFAIGGYCDYHYPGEEVKYKEVNEYDDLIGKKITINETEYTVTGIVDTHVDIDRYKGLTDDPEGMSTADRLVNYALMQELDYITDYSLASVAMVGEGFVDRLLENIPPKGSLGIGYAELYSEDSYIYILML
ncbi:MAG: ABC transporter ATP-binding protein [Butyrivibrio sp.]